MSQHRDRPDGPGPKQLFDGGVSNEKEKSQRRKELCVKMINLALKTSSTSLSVSRLPFDTFDFQKVLADHLQSPGCLIESLFVESTHVNLENFRLFVDGLAGNSTLTNLSLGNSLIGDAGVVLLCKALEVSNARIRYLDIEDVGMTQVGAAAVANLLFSFSSFVHVNLDNNEIGDAGAALIADSLKVNSTLKSVFIAGNEIGPAGIIAIFKALKNNRSLTKINVLYENDVEKAGLAALAEMLTVNHTLCYSYVDNRFHTEIAQYNKRLVNRINAHLAQNREWRDRTETLKKNSRALFAAFVPVYDPKLDNEERFAQELVRDAAAQVFDRLRYLF